MKKRSLLGILAVLMVFALALTGCGQQGEQNAGATGSGDGNGVSVSEPVKEPETNDTETGTITDETPDVSTPLNKSPSQDADGNYIYTITVDGVRTEVKTCINVWDYITDDTPYDRVDFLGMAESLGWYYNGEVSDISSVRFNRENDIFAIIAGVYDVDDYNLPSGERRVYELAVDSADSSGLPYMYDAGGEMLACGDMVYSKNILSGDLFLVGDKDVYVSFDQIVVFACMVDSYRDAQVPLFRTSDAIFVNVP